MLAGTARQNEFWSWVYVTLWSGAVFATVPYVRDVTNYVREEWNSEVFTYIVAAIVILFSAVAIALLLKQRQKSLSRYAWLLAIAALIVYQTFELKASSPEEAIHFLQYGILSLLLYRAFVHRISDYSIYVAATIVGTFVGMIDETIQWLTPGRYFGLEDIWLNFKAVGLVQLAVAAGIRPSAISGWPDMRSLRRLCRLGAMALAYLGLCHLNTPDEIAWYTATYPSLALFDMNRSTMIEYGYLHGNAETGFFRSRLTLEELRRLDPKRASKGARILDGYRGKQRYREFLESYTPVSDPFLHEVRVHLFRRDVYLERARNADEIDEQRRFYSIAYWESRILENYFGEIVRASSYQWPTELKAEIKDNANTELAYTSKVSHHLITAYSRAQAFWFFLCIVLGLLLLGRYFGNRASG